MLSSGYGQAISGIDLSQLMNANPSLVNQRGADIVAAFVQGVSKVCNGTKPIVVCAGQVTEAKDMDEAQHIAEREAHSKATDAYILKPVRRVAPKREVVSTDL